ncbi:MULTISPECIES: MFS transporter [Streptomyces]|uniref:MFS transporter n=1 Tax=Streptomyces TaxID=1883 RepID=UPI001CCFE31A|nr:MULTISPECIES: MFS transporter [Streptomyces]UBI41013.1 MFS transporter [Streptomyces mobaraensis]UKW33496.1 MFS transporter [Streptomyces sp. TYQ1024]
MPSGTVAPLLLVYGAFGLAGNFAAGASAARRARATVLALALGIGAAVALLALFGGVGGAAGVGIVLWGLAYGGLSVAGQIWMTRSAPDRVERVTGLYVGVFTAAIALGAFLGGAVVEASGATLLLRHAAALAAVALAVGLYGPGSAGGSAPGRKAVLSPVGRKERGRRTTPGARRVDLTPGGMCREGAQAEAVRQEAPRAPSPRAPSPRAPSPRGARSVRRRGRPLAIGAFASPGCLRDVVQRADAESRERAAGPGDRPGGAVDER